MDNALTAKLQSACRQVGVSDAVAQRLIQEVIAPEVSRLQQENERLRAQVQRQEKVDRELVMLLHAKGPTDIVHAARNVLNELTLLKAVAGDD